MEQNTWAINDLIVFIFHHGTVVTHLSPTYDVGGLNPRLYVGKLIVAY